MAAFRQVPPHRFGFGHHFVAPLSAGATNTPVLPCFSHNGRRQQRRQRRQRHAEIHSGLPHQSSSSRRCAETRHYTAEPAAVPLTPVAIHHRLFPRHVRCPIIVDLSYSHASGTPPRPHACTVQEGFPYGTELSRVAGNRHRDHRVRPQARCDPDHHRVRRGDCARRRIIPKATSRSASSCSAWA